MNKVTRKTIGKQWTKLFWLPVCVAVVCTVTPAAGNDLIANLAAGQEPVLSQEAGDSGASGLDQVASISSAGGSTAGGADTLVASTGQGGLSGSPKSKEINVPQMNQYTAGGKYPGGYCAITALRMLLRHLGIGDPGADAVALQGSRPYIPGQGSSGQLLARRAQELGIPGAKYTTNGSTSDIKNSLSRGKPVLTGGIGQFNGTFENGAPESHNYAGSGHWMLTTGYDNGNKTFTVNDPATGRKIHVGENAFKRFFSPGGDGNIWMISY